MRKAGEHLVAPSLLAADFGHLASDIQMVNGSLADWYHIDVMDGVFVPNISLGIPVMKAISEHSEKFCDVHLMISRPEQFIQPFAQAGAELLTVHIEVATHLHKIVNDIKNAGMRAGVALNPHTPVNTLEEILPYIDLALIMSVNPGFGGQSFIETTPAKIQKLRALADRLNPSLLIEVDGGINAQTAEMVLKAGADVIVSGSYVFNSEDPVSTVNQLKNINVNTLTL